MIDAVKSWWKWQSGEKLSKKQEKNLAICYGCNERKQKNVPMFVKGVLRIQPTSVCTRCSCPIKALIKSKKVCDKWKIN